MVPAGNKAKRLSPVNHTTKTIHHPNRLLVENVDAYLHNQLPSLVCFAISLFWVLWACLQKRWYQLVENFNVHHCSRNYIYPSPLLKYC